MAIPQIQYRTADIELGELLGGSLGPEDIDDVDDTDDTDTVKGGKGSGNFGHKGRKGKEGGSSQGDETEIEPQHLIFYHGTTDEAIESIKKEGLVPRRGKGYHRLVSEKAGEDIADDYYVGYRKASVFFSPSKSRAQNYADAYASHYNIDAVVLKITIPADKLSKVKLDEKDHEGRRMVGKIPPEWITFDDTKAVGSTEGLVFYAVIFVKPEET